MLRNGKTHLMSLDDTDRNFHRHSSAYEVWGSPEMLTKEKAKRAKTRQDDYEGMHK